MTGRKTAVEDFPKTAVHLKRCSFPAQRCCTSIQQHTYTPLSPSGVDKQTAHRHVPVYRVRHTDSKRTTTLDISPPVCAACIDHDAWYMRKNICCLYFQNKKTFLGERRDPPTAPPPGLATNSAGRVPARRINGEFRATATMLCLQNLKHLHY